MQATRFKLSYLSLAIATLFAATQPAHAQQVTEKAEAEAAKQADQDTNTQRVTVTSRRRAESIVDVPIAVTAIGSKELERANIQNLADLTGKVPNLSIYAARGSNTTLTAFIRGVGQADPLWGVDPGVGVYIDDVYIARPQGAVLDVFDTQRVEVLRGPQGTLYGKNTIGGAIKYVSKPLSTTTTGNVEVGIGNYSQKNLKAAIGGATDDGVWRARVAIASLNRGGFGHNTVTGEDVSDQDTAAGRLTVGYYPTGSAFSATLAADMVNDDSGVRGSRRLAPNALETVKTPITDSRYDITSGMPNINRTHSKGLAFTAKYDLNSDWALKYIYAHRKSDTFTTIDFDNVQQKIADVVADYNDKQDTHELQAVYQVAGGASGVIGAYYFDGWAGGLVKNNFLNLLFGTTNGKVYTTSKAVYGDWSMPLGERFSVGAGVRYTQESKRAVVDNRGYPNATFSVSNAVTAQFDNTATTNKVSPKLSASYKLDANNNLYASFSRGFKSGGYNIRANTAAVPASGRPFLDETLDSFEIGSKTASTDGNFGLNTAFFHNKYKNIQLSIFTSFVTAAGQPSFFGDFTNAGKGTVNGAEFEVYWKPTANFTLNANYAYLDTKFDEYIDRGVNVASQKWFTDAPKNQLGVTAEYVTPLSYGGTLRARLNYNHRSKVYPTTDLTEAIAQPGFGLVNAGIIWERDRNWTFALQGTNLADKEYRTSGYNIASLGVLTGFYGAPRQVTLTAGYKF
jgi:iron complex outermembrane receptor protein